MKLVPYHSGSCTARISLCVKLALSEGDININETSRRTPSSQHNCGLSENPGTIDWLPAGEF